MAKRRTSLGRAQAPDHPGHGAGDVPQTAKSGPGPAAGSNAGEAPAIGAVQDTGTLGKAIALLDLVAAAPEPLRFSEILRRSGQPRGSLHRQLRHLLQEGLLDLSPEGTYAPGLRLLIFASKAWARNTPRRVAEPHLQMLQQLTGETVHFGVLNGGEIVYLDKLESRQAVRMHSHVGNAAPVYCTGVGKAALSVLEDDVLRHLLAGLRPRRFTEHTLVEVEALEAELATIRRRGFAYDMEEHQPGIRCVAAPIRVASRGFVGGVSVTAPAFRANPAQLDLWAASVTRAARAIEQHMDGALAPR
ncbi:IclR family transcriptional regulator [Rhizobium sp. SSA_523]|uniref:IclR family transcriptional regulator n=1 Tax=Rhizobium sp. SSA_523 TaxID=2952477 RepID=UPI0020916747|nr:IclR family transcriptional regulator [Rhizobium sp. SSA_523]MCO5731128.1 IclR family transcriptional regulator [Rhizobium sp. SSA_523]WKC24076.1 IclR family transcriptional regulator [Rhizobium sp. SSA_523]